MRLRLPNNWTPRDYQRPAWDYLEQGGKRLYAVWHRRAGKDDVALHWAAVAAHTRIGTYWHMLPEASQARKAVWDAINESNGKRRIDEAFPPEIRSATRENEMFIRFKSGSTWQVVGSDNYDSLVGSPPIGVVFSEWALAKPQAWAYLRPILTQNGGWAAFITTPRGNNHAAKMYDTHLHDDEWFVQKLTVAETGVFTPEQLEKERRGYIADYGPSDGERLYEQEYVCSFSATNLGAIYPKELDRAKADKRITKVPYTPEKLVSTAWDIGWGDSTAIWFYQQIAGEVRIIDYYEDRNEPLTHYLEKLRSKDYKYDTCWLPHDAENGTMTGKTIAEIARSNGFRVQIAPKLSLVEGINAARLMFARAYFDEEKCAAGLQALENYRWDINKRLDELKDTPVHDWASHGADAFRYLAVSLRAEPMKQSARQKPNIKWVV